MFTILEIKSLIAYLKKNWRQIFIYLSIGLLLFWTLSISQLIVDIDVSKLKNLLPPVSFILILGWLVAITQFPKLIHFWSYYRNSYFSKEPLFTLADSLLLILLPSYYWLYYQPVYESEYFQMIFSTVIFFLAFTYLIALHNLWKQHTVQQRIKGDKFEGKTVLFSDEPIDDLKDDWIGRGEFAKALKENIYNLSFKESFVMALYGQWGEGKTSILNLLKSEIKKEKQLLVYEFGPWFFGDENALTINFYRGLEDSLQENYFIPRKIRKLFRFYPEILIKGLTSIGISFNGANEEDRPIELKKHIEEFVAGLDKRVLVVIDDIDRLQKDEILAVFRLIKLTSHMKNLVFLISLDVPRVIRILEDGGVKDPSSYIEKIVQLPINLPMTDPGKVDKFLLFSYPVVEYKSEIDKLFDRIELDPVKRQEFDKEFTKIYQSDLRQIFSTYRAAKRYLNSVLFRLPFIEREVFLYDFFIVEIIQTFYPELYADMKSSPWYYFSSKWSWESIALSPLPYDEDERRQAIKNHIEAITKDIQKKEVVISLLESIFPEVQNAFSRSGANYHSDSGIARIQKRITHPECYPKYFMLGTREGLIPDAEFEDLLRRWKESSNREQDMEESLFGKYQKEFKLIQLFERLKLHSESLDEELVLPIVKTLSKNSRKLQGEGEWWKTEFDQADGLIFRLIEDRKSVIADEAIQPLLKEIVSDTTNLHLASLIVLTCVEGGGSSLRRVRENVNINELRGTLRKRLKEYFIDGNKDIFEEYPHEREFAFILYQWATNWGESSTSIKDEVNDYLVKLFKEKPTHIGLFLRHNIKEPHSPFDGRKYFDYQGFKIAYDPDKLATCLAELEDRAYPTPADKEAIDQFLEKHREAGNPTDPALPESQP